MVKCSRKGEVCNVFRMSLAFTILTCVPSLAQGQVDRGVSFPYDQGQRPSVAARDLTARSVVVEVHQAGSDLGPLWYRVGYVNGVLEFPPISWGTSNQYDNGQNPSVAIDYYSGANVFRVVEVHQAGDSLWYRVAQLVPGASSIQWQQSHQYDNGANPRVAFAQGVIVEVHQAGDCVGSLLYHVGRFTGSAISWWDSHEYDNGENPFVTKWNADVVEVHQSADGSAPGWYRAGKLNGSTVDWKPSDQYVHPSVALFFNGAVEVHETGDGGLSYRLGVLQQ